MGYLKNKNYEIVPSGTYEILRGCPGCGEKSVYQSTGKIRVNANGKRLDVWLIYRCQSCKHTYNLPIYSRVARDSLDREEYETLQKNDLALIARYGRSRALFQRNGAKIAGELPYEIRETGGEAGEGVIQIQNPAQIRVRPDRLLSECLGISRTQAKRLLDSGALLAEKPALGGTVVFRRPGGVPGPERGGEE